MHLLPTLDIGAAARGTAELATALSRGGGQPIVLSEGGRLVPDILRAGARHVTAPAAADGAFARGRLALQIRRLIRREDIALLHARSPGTAWAARYAARAGGQPVVVSLHEHFTPASRRERWYAAAVAQADHVIAVSTYIADHAINDLGVPPERVTVIPSGLNLTRFNPGGVVADRVIKLAQRWLLPDGVPLILMAGSLRADKGHRLLIEALAHLGERPFAALMIGDDQNDDKATQRYIKDMEDLALSRGLGGKVRFAGFCADMPAAYMLADVVVNPSLLPEAFDLTAAEAQAMGRPVIAGNHGATSEIILPDQTGWLIKPNSAHALATAIEQAISMDVPAREALALMARERVSRQFSIDRMCAKTLALYRSLLDRRAG
nr:glycosyltransferase family 4 protein [Govania unica]